MTPFEEFLFWDAKIPGSPADAVTHLVFRGLMDRETLERAFYSLLKDTPHAVETLEEREGGVAGWVTRPEHAEKVALPLGEPFLWWFDAPYREDAVPVGVLEPIHMTETPGVRVAVFRDADAGRTDVILHFHHVATDAGGSFLFLEELLRRYAEIAAGDSEDAPKNREETPWEKANLPASAGKVRIDFPLAWMLMKEAVRWSAYVLNPWRRRVWRITAPRSATAAGHRWEVESSADVNENAPQKDTGMLSARTPYLHSADGKPALPTREYFLSPEETASMRAAAKRLGVTMNDLLVTACFGASHRWRVWREGEPLKPARVVYRMAVPVSLRGVTDQKFGLLGNAVSILFLNCRPCVCEKTPPHALLLRNAEMMRKLKRTGAYRILLRAVQGLHELRWGKGHPRWGAELYVRRQPAFASFVLSNVGPLFTGAWWPRSEDGKIRVADLVLDDVHVASPRTINVGIFCPIITYAGRLRLTAVYDPQRLSALEAGRWLTFLADELRTLYGSNMK